MRIIPINLYLCKTSFSSCDHCSVDYVIAMRMICIKRQLVNYFEIQGREYFDVVDSPTILPLYIKEGP